MISSNIFQEGLLFRAVVWYQYNDTMRMEFVDLLSKQISIGSSMVSMNKASAQFMSEDIIGKKGTR